MILNCHLLEINPTAISHSEAFFQEWDNEAWVGGWELHHKFEINPSRVAANNLLYATCASLRGFVDNAAANQA